MYILGYLENLGFSLVTTSFEHQAAATTGDAQDGHHEPKWGTQLVQHITFVFGQLHVYWHGRCPMWHMSANVPTASVHTSVYAWCANDPSAGSPTETLLRLLLPLSDKVH